MRDRDAGKPRPHALAHLAWNRRHGRKPTDQRLEIEPAAADEDRQTRLRARLGKGRRRIGDELSCRKIDRRIGVAVKPMRRTRLVLFHRPRGQNPQIAIDLHGIDVDDHAARCFSQFKRKRRLAAGGRSCDKHGLAALA